MYQQQAIHLFLLLLLFLSKSVFSTQLIDMKQFQCETWGKIARYQYLDYQVLIKDESIESPMSWIKDSLDYDYYHIDSAGRKLLDIIISGLVDNKSESELTSAVIKECLVFPLHALESEYEAISETELSNDSWSQSELASETYCEQKSFSEFGNTRTCIENLALDEAQFDAVCNQPSDELIRVESKYVLNCPANYKGVCYDLKTQHGHPMPYISYLYENDMPFMQKACLEAGGRWEVGR